jgi:hypothetical protein
VGRKDKNGVQTKRCYDAEHVLEWQLLRDFIQEDFAKKDDSRCALLWKFFHKTKMPKIKHKVMVAKNNGKMINGHFDYETTDYDFSK